MTKSARKSAKPAAEKRSRFIVRVTLDVPGRPTKKQMREFVQTALDLRRSVRNGIFKVRASTVDEQ
jgi:hypothetical protein